MQVDVRHATMQFFIIEILLKILLRVYCFSSGWTFSYIRGGQESSVGVIASYGYLYFCCDVALPLQLRAEHRLRIYDDPFDQEVYFFKPHL
uniref:Uncharacterized protein n=1 Tax=Romanomermis culicivorax TaxID=13658 RepID=A0A915HMA1_ROMCU